MLIPFVLLIAPFVCATLTNVTVGTPNPDDLPDTYHWISETYLSQTYVRSEEKDAFVLFGFEGAPHFIVQWMTVDDSLLSLRPIA